MIKECFKIFLILGVIVICIWLIVQILLSKQVHFEQEFKGFFICSCILVSENNSSRHN